MKRFAVIMAGGSGSRLWPLSRRAEPKQIHPGMLDGRTLLEATIGRIRPLFSETEILVSASARHREPMENLLERCCPGARRLYQPENRNNAPFSLYLAWKIMEEEGDAVLCMLPSDHLVENEETLAEELAAVMDQVEKTAGIVCLGTKPHYAATRFGYLKTGPLAPGQTGMVQAFKEKPDYETARRYLADGAHLWNTGIYVWRASTLVQNFERYLPRVYHALLPVVPHLGTAQESSRLADCYRDVPDMSLDYGIMEHTEELYVRASELRWRDVGCYDSLMELFEPDEEKNHVRADHIGIGSRGNIIVSEHQTVCSVGLEDTVVVVRDDVVLVARKDRLDDMKHLMALLEERGREELL